VTSASRFRNNVGSYGFLDDPAGRAVRGSRIVTLLREFHRTDLDTLCMLDVGCSAGLMTREVARQMSFAVGVDPDPSAIRYATDRLSKSGQLSFACCAGEALPFADETFDIVLCNHVYEHAQDPHAMMREIARVLRHGGVCWFAAGHAFQLIEPHYRLPLLSLLPRPIASWIVRVARRGDEYDIRFLPPWRMQELFAPFQHSVCLTSEILRAPDRYGLQQSVLQNTAIRAAVRVAAPLLAWVAPTQHWLLTRK